MRSFITGINGFAGSYLAEALLENGDEVAGTIFPGTGLDNIEKIRKRVALYDLDIINKGILEAAIKSFMPDHVFHLAGASCVSASFDDPFAALQVNTIGTLNVLHLVNGLVPRARVLLVTSGEIYGESLSEAVLTDEEAKITPQSPYGVSKAAADMLGHVYARSFNLNIIIARPFSHIGPRQLDAFFIPTVARQLAEIKTGKKGKTLRLGELNRYRDFTDVRDMVRAYMLLISKGKSGEAYNICSGNNYLLKDLVDIMIKLAQESVSIALDTEKIRKIDLTFLRPDNKKIKEETGWEPIVPITDTLRETLSYWMERSAIKA